MMKKMIIAMIASAVFAFMYPVIISLLRPFDVLPENDQGSSLTETSSPSGNDISDEAERIDEGIKLNVLKDDGIVYEMTMKDYLLSVVAAEMPAQFDVQALMAQAVAARTYTLYNMLARTNKVHENADVCTDYACCKAFIELSSLPNVWGERYGEYMDKITKAVSDTDGEYLSYNDEIVLAVFHSSSAGMTENSQSVWNTSLPYLVSVESPEQAEKVPNFETTVTMTHKEFVDTVKATYPEAVFGNDIMVWVGETQHTESGRVSYINIGGVELQGTDVRALFGLRSAFFTLSITDAAAVFNVTGYGHGVGMSQYGANILAGEGKNYDEILKWYYTGAEIKNASGLEIKR